MADAVSTYSICACDLAAGQWGVATQSKFLAVGSIVPWAVPHVGAIATQSYANPRYGPDGLALLREGLSATEVVERLTVADDGRASRQLGVVDGEGGAATYTGEDCHAWAGGRAGDGYAAQGNILVSAATVDALAETFDDGAGKPLSARLLDALDAAEAAGGDSRGRQSAALLVVERDAGYAGLSDTLVDLRVDDHVDPLGELRRLFGLHEGLFGRTPRDQWIPVDGALRAELDELLARDGPRLSCLVGRSRESRGTGRRRGEIDPVVLERLGAPRDQGLPGRPRSTSSSAQGIGRPRVAHDPVDTRDRRLRHQRVDGDGGRPALIGEHDEVRDGEGHEELYLVLSAATLRSRSTGRRSTPPREPRARARSVRQARRDRQHGTTMLVVGAKPGEVFSSSPWERTRRRRFASGRPRSGKGDRGTRGPCSPRCRTSQARTTTSRARGARRPTRRRTRASERAVELQPSFAETSHGRDDDLASIRDDPRFPAG